MSLSYDVVKDSLPKAQRNVVTEELIDKLNDMNKDPSLLGSFKENFLGYMEVMKTGKYRIQDYVNAVRFVSYKLIGKSDIDAYSAVFPERYQTLKDQGLSRDQMSPYTSAYKKNKLVIQIMEQTLVPDHIINAPMRQQALNQLADIMLNGRSEMARVQAANNILVNTKAPETTKIELDIGMKENDVIAELRNTTQLLAKQQRLAIESGVSTPLDIANSKVIEAEIE